MFVNILIAIVTSQYEKAQEKSHVLFAKSRLEAAAQHSEYRAIPHGVHWCTKPTLLILKTHQCNGKVARRGLKMGVLFTGVVEYFLIMSLLSCASLHRDGILGGFLYVALILCAILHHVFVAAAGMYAATRAISKWECLRCLRDTAFHKVMLKVCLAPVSGYLLSVGLGDGEKCPDLSDSWDDDHALTRDEFLEKQGDYEQNVQEAIKMSEARILQALRSMAFENTKKGGGAQHWALPDAQMGRLRTEAVNARSACSYRGGACG